MKTFLTGCGIPILLFALFFAGYAQVFVPRFEPDWLAYVFAGVCALMLCLAFGAVKTFLQTNRIAGALRRVRAGLVPGEGEWTLVNGQVTAVGEPISTPFSNKPCVSYEYEIYRLASTGADRRLDSSDRDTHSSLSKDPCAFGLAKTECTIRTARGDVRPLGYPTLDHFTKGACHFSEHPLEGPYERGLSDCVITSTYFKNPDVQSRHT